MNTTTTLYFVSDLHLEFSGASLTKKLLQTFPSATILVVAGDICPVYKDKGKLLKTFLEAAKKKYEEVVFIAGNHEFYHSDCKYDQVIEILKECAEATQTHFLHRSKTLVKDIVFIGATLWSRIQDRAVYQISDFRCGVFHKPEDYIKHFVFDYDYLRNALEEDAKENKEHPVVVVTHHLPSIHLIHKRFQNSLVNSAFFTERLNTFNLSNVCYWVCGHTHEFATFQKDQTLLIVNPVGYPGEQKQTRLSLQTYEKLTKN